MSEEKFNQKEYIDALVKEALEEAKKEAAKIIKEATDEAKSIRASKKTETREKGTYNGDELVYVRLPHKENAGDVFISVNNENCVIKRGEPVYIKRKFYDCLKDSEQQDEYALILQEQEEKKSEKRLSEFYGA